MLLNSESINEDLGMLFLRLSTGGTIFWLHGWPKLMAFSQVAENFADPFGLGSTVSLILILLAEVLCGALVVLGLWTRIATIPLIIAMAVIVFMVKADAPFKESELAFVYLASFVALLFAGSGRYSVDRIRFG
ncbi:MAG: DoxX family protein [Flavobacteriales bacterium]|nr:DoxX family protein [Flavobacteriales bacterium]MBK6945299.1 DoxX family protein [Flavobacteriales bacterium]MBK7298300.1 DoxX family protein [Flavobacteriales bacterium]MBK9535144.1 DoxX family protein [Flavobacteriales bacterium]MBP9139941.1 DoxX family protein [Flavobacteriales bacterium]